MVPQADGVTYNITGGTRPDGGPNLFHSFGKFSVGQGDLANFSNDSGLPTSNIFGRIDGRETSSIFGTIRSTEFGSANLFLINPSGWVFGPTAVLDVGGSFHASTAHYVRFSDDGRFYVDPAQETVLTVAAPVAFGFLGPTGSILVSGSSFLQVPEGQTLSLVGGNVQITADTDTGSTTLISAPSGRIQIGSFASVGEAAVDGLTGNFSSLGNVEISVGSSINVADIDVDPAIVNGGTIFIRGGQIDISGSLMEASGYTDFGFTTTAGGGVVIRGGTLFVDGSTINSDTYGDVDGAPFDVSLSENIVLTNGASIRTTASADFGFGVGRGGDIEITAPLVSIDGSFVVGSTFGSGTAGKVSFTAGTLAISNGGGVGSLGGNVSVDATQSVVISGRDAFGTPSSLFTSTEGGTNAGVLSLSAPMLTMSDFGTITSTTLGALGGNIEVTVDRLSITGGANIDSHTGGTSDGGNIMVTVTNAAVIAGIGSDGSPSGIFSDTCALCTGRAGDVTFQAGTLTLTQGALIQSGSTVDPQGGNVTVASSGSIVISEGSGISAQAGAQDVGQVLISASSVLVDGGFISASALGQGQGGEIVVSAETVNLLRGGRISSSSSPIDPLQFGDAGAIDITARNVSLSGPGSGLLSTASGGGNAGQIRVSASVLSVADGATVDSSTTGAGNGGAINVSAASQVEISSGGSVRADSTGSGLTGNIAISAGDQIVMSEGSISTRAATSDGGNVTLTAPNIIRLENSQITTSVESGTGGGGNIFIDPQFVILNGSSITANAFGGPGGSVTIVADNFLTDPSSFVSASSALSTPGTVQIESPENNVAGDIAQLPRELVDASRLMQGACSARRSGAPSSFTVAGRGGVPADPDGYLPSYSASGAPFAGARGAAPAQGFALAMAGWDCWR